MIRCPTLSGPQNKPPAGPVVGSEVQLVRVIALPRRIQLFVTRWQYDDVRPGWDYATVIPGIETAKRRGLLVAVIRRRRIGSKGLSNASPFHIHEIGRVPLSGGVSQHRAGQLF